MGVAASASVTAEQPCPDPVVRTRPDVILHQMTALASLRSLKKFDTEFVLTSAPTATRGPFEVDDARAYIGKVRWQFAKTMPRWPHEYTVRQWRPDLEAEFEAFATLIRKIGVVKPWPRTSKAPKYHHTYLTIDDFEYWTMGAPIVDTTVINRAVPG